MATLLALAPYLLLIAYLALAVDYGVLFFTGQTPARRLGSIPLWLTILAHAGYLILLTLQWRQFPTANVAQAFAVVGFTVALVYAWLERLGRERAAGLWMIGPVALFQLLAVLLHEEPPPRIPAFENPLFGLHVFLGLLGYAAFAVAASHGFLFLRLYRELKRGRFTVFFGQLPPLEVLERMMVGALWVGFLALTGALVDGFVWLDYVDRGQWLSDPIIVLSAITWLLYGAALVLRRAKRWHGRQTALVSLAGFGIIVGSLLVVRALLSTFHRPL